MNARSKIQFATEFEDARDTAKLARELDIEDVLAVPQYHAYVNVVAGGHPSGWALVQTLPAPPSCSDPEAVWATAMTNYAPSSPAGSANPPAAATAEPASISPVVGRKRRARK
jgi:hypothetical protein